MGQGASLPARCLHTSPTRESDLVPQEPHHERDGGGAEIVPQGGGERAGTAGVVRAIEYEPSAVAREDLEASRPPGARKTLADRGVADAEDAGRRDREERVLGLEAPEHA